MSWKQLTDKDIDKRHNANQGMLQFDQRHLEMNISGTDFAGNYIKYDDEKTVSNEESLSKEPTKVEPDIETKPLTALEWLKKKKTTKVTSAESTSGVGLKGSESEKLNEVDRSIETIANTRGLLKSTKHISKARKNTLDHEIYSIKHKFNSGWLMDDDSDIELYIKKKLEIEGFYDPNNQSDLNFVKKKKEKKVNTYKHYHKLFDYRGYKKGDICSLCMQRTATHQHHIAPRESFPEYEDLEKNPWNFIWICETCHHKLHSNGNLKDSSNPIFKNYKLEIRHSDSHEGKSKSRRYGIIYSVNNERYYIWDEDLLIKINGQSFEATELKNKNGKFPKIIAIKDINEESKETSSVQATLDTKIK